MNKPALVCSKCDKSYMNSEPVWRCTCGGLLDIDFTPDFSDGWVDGSRAGLWRYRSAIPIENDRNIVSFGEGNTPLMPFDIADRDVYLKLDHLLPSGSFKDRGATALVSKIKELAIDKIVEDSSGNAGASIAEYSAKAGIDCSIYVPASTSEAKTLQIRASGASLVLVPGSREDTAQAVLAEAKHRYYASHSWNPWFFQGVKTVAYEICEHLGWKSPDSVVLPVGNGTLVLGAIIGFQELFSAGIIAKIPRIIAVQTASCCPLASAFKSGSGRPETVVTQVTVAEGIAVAEPVRGKQILDAVRKSDGQILTVSEQEITSSWNEMAELGLYVEPTSAVAWAGVKQYSKVVSENEVIVSIITGHGLKAAKGIQAILDNE